MASTLASDNKVLVTYVPDSGPSFNVAMKAVYAAETDAATKLGIAAPVDSQINMPNEFKPRKVKMTDGLGHSRWIIAYTTAATIWTTAGITFSLDLAGVDTTFTSTVHHRGEKQGRSGTDLAFGA